MKKMVTPYEMWKLLKFIITNYESQNAKYEQ